MNKNMLILVSSAIGLLFGTILLSIIVHLTVEVSDLLRFFLDINLSCFVPAVLISIYFTNNKIEGKSIDSLKMIKVVAISAILGVMTFIFSKYAYNFICQYALENISFLSENNCVWIPATAIIDAVSIVFALVVFKVVKGTVELPVVLMILVLAYIISSCIGFFTPQYLPALYNYTVVINYVLIGGAYGFAFIKAEN